MEHPKEFIKFSTSHMFYFLLNETDITVICPKYSKPITLLGSGVVTIPTGCKVRHNGEDTFSLGHIGRSVDLTIKMDSGVWFTNLSHIVPLLKVANVENVSTLWSDMSEEEKVIETGIMDVENILSTLEFSPDAITWTLWSLISWTVILVLIIVGICVLLCYPGAIISCKRCCCCCCLKKERIVRDSDF